MSSPTGGWRPPVCDSRTGAAHLRRGSPCQDASVCWTFPDGAGDPVQVLVVSDGHGGLRYDRSEVGSYLACHAALKEVHRLLRRARTSQPGGEAEWQQWLAEELPRRIVGRWRQEVLAHARTHPRDDQDAAGATFPYGATLGLLLLTPRWWGHSGLGDWDLVRIDSEGNGELLSEEPDTAGGGEATFSLCMDGAERHFAARSGLHPIAPGCDRFSLLLSTDGIRKSCGTDADFFTLAEYLSNLPAAAVVDPPETTDELSQALDRISDEGSGDDVSVAIGRWLPTAVGERSPGGRRGADPPRIVQPPLQPAPGRDRPLDPEALPRGAAPPRRAARRRWIGAGGRSPLPLPLAAGLLLLTLIGAGLGVAALLALGPFAQRAPRPAALTPRQWALLQREAQRLCSPEALIGSREAMAGSAAGPRPPRQAVTGDSIGAAGGAVAPPPAADNAGGGAAAGRSEPDRGAAGRNEVGRNEAGRGDATRIGPGHREASAAEAGRIVPGQGEPGPIPPARITPDRGHADGSDPAGRQAGQGEPGRQPQLPPAIPGQPPAPALDPGLRQSIEAELNQRRSTFVRLRQDPRHRDLLLADPARDPLGALIAWSFGAPGLGPGATTSPPAGRSDRLPGWWPLGRAAPLPAAPRLCPELRQALQQQWQGRSVQLRSAAAPPAAPPR
ncbi:MAG: protein phosphatase 2C domain-containing protein [Synechococcus sp.]|nr:protein phosphatase 2C domain-containing protein [Synechococcus sp.]